MENELKSINKKDSIFSSAVATKDQNTNNLTENYKPIANNQNASTSNPGGSIYTRCLV